MTCLFFPRSLSPHGTPLKSSFLRALSVWTLWNDSWGGGVHWLAHGGREWAGSEDGQWMGYSVPCMLLPFHMGCSLDGGNF